MHDVEAEGMTEPSGCTAMDAQTKGECLFKQLAEDKQREEGIMGSKEVITLL